MPAERACRPGRASEANGEAALGNMVRDVEQEKPGEKDGESSPPRPFDVVADSERECDK